MTSRIMNRPFGGLPLARRSPRVKQGQLGFYYLGLDRASSIYAQGTGREQRHTVGAKWSGSWSRLDLDYDAYLSVGNLFPRACPGLGFLNRDGLPDFPDALEAALQRPVKQCLGRQRSGRSQAAGIQPAVSRE